MPSDCEISACMYSRSPWAFTEGRMEIAMIPKIVIPDDAPPVMLTSRAYRGLLERTAVSYYDTLPGSEGRLIERVADAEIVINIRASSRFSERVFSNSPRLCLLSIWGTGTDNVDLA